MHLFTKIRILIPSFRLLKYVTISLSRMKALRRTAAHKDLHLQIEILHQLNILRSI